MTNAAHRTAKIRTRTLHPLNLKTLFVRERNRAPSCVSARIEVTPTTELPTRNTGGTGPLAGIEIPVRSFVKNKFSYTISKFQIYSI
jgi:hypothetical protein